MPSFCPGVPYKLPTSSEYKIVAPRCYCLLSRFPFFNLHFQFLYSLLGMSFVFVLFLFFPLLSLCNGVVAPW